MTADTSLAEQLETFIQRALEARSVRVTNLRRLTGGASRETSSFDATIERDAAAPETVALILQRDTRGVPKQMTRALEYALLRAAHGAGVPTPEPFLMGDGSLGEFFLVRRIEGENLPRRLLRDDVYANARHALPAQLGRALAQIHAIPIDMPGFDALERPPDAVAHAAWSLDKHEQLYRGIALDPHPAFELAFRWLRARVSDGAKHDRRALVHGDFRMGNVMFDETGLQAVLDWELTHIGDPAEDLGWISVRSWRFGGAQPVGGIGTREEFFAAYEEAGGATVDPEWVRFWEVFGTLRWGIICLSQARVYLDGHSKSVELASIGRRTAETEWELLNIMEQG